MTSRSSAAFLTLTILLVLAGCSRDLDLLGLAPFPPDPEVFTDQFGAAVGFQAFLGSKVDALSVDTDQRRNGSASLRVTVPAPGDPSGGYAGGAFVTNTPRDLSGYDALTFWAKSSIPVTLNTAGLGNDNTGMSRFIAEVSGLPLTTSWTKFTIPIPLPSKLDREQGLFYFAEGAEGSVGYEIWFDDIQFESLGTLADPRPAIPDQTLSGTVGATLPITGTSVTFDVAGSDVRVSASPDYFTFTSDDTGVATVDEGGVVSVVGEGSATITAALGQVPASGSVVVETAATPTAAAPPPARDAADVISMFSDAYTDVSVDTWRTSWTPPAVTLTDTDVSGNAVKLYEGLSGQFLGIEMLASPIDASGMTGFSMDIWTPDATADAEVFKVKLVDLGPDGSIGTGDDTEHEVTLTASTTPSLATGEWVTLNIPFSDFTNLTTRGAIGQLILSGDLGTVFVDNVYFYSEPAPTAPTTAAPTPTRDAADVISMFSDAYTDVTVDTWRTSWTPGAVTLTETDVAGNAVKLYEGLAGQFLGIEMLASPIDASNMTGFTMDIWTPDATSGAEAFRVKLVDAGADGGVGTGGDDSEHEVVLTGATTPALGTGSWITLDIPLSAFTNLTGQGAIAQLILAGDLGTVYVDNVYFYSTAVPTTPTTAAPTPTRDAAGVISMFSDAYTDVSVDTWRTSWTPGAVTLTETDVAGDAVKLYEGLAGQFLGIEMLGSPIDASNMTGFTMDIWTPDATDGTEVFRVKLVDAGADGGVGSGGDDTEHEVVLTAATTPALGTGSWITLDIPLSDFTNLTNRGAIAQLILSGDLGTVHVDNVYFYSAAVPTAPTTAAPTPTRDAAGVISMFSDAYTDVTVDTWRTSWTPPSVTLTETDVAGDAVKLYEGLAGQFLGIEMLGSPIDASNMTGFTMDIWTPDATDGTEVFRVKLVDAGADGGVGSGGDDTEHEVVLTAATTPALGTGSWITLDIPLSDFTNLTNRGAIAQLILSGDLDTVYVDNVYFHD